MRYSSLLVALASGALAEPAVAQAIAGDAAVQAQWFTGSLEAPSPALPKAGLLAVEPYVIYTGNTGAYDNGGGHLSVPDDVTALTSVIALKYGITDRLTVQALPSFSHAWNSQSNATGIGDLPVELEYRFNDEDNKTGFPSVTASVGMTLPTGDYDHLRASLDGLGSGAYTLKEGILLQSLFDTAGHHPVRLRFYGAAFEPVSDVSLQDMSVYGTAQGFQGHAAPGLAAELGIGAGYAFTQSWVLAFDFVQHFSNGTHLIGNEALGGVVDTKGSSSARTALAPAIEYNFSDNLGIIAGVEFSVAGRNTSSYVAPQIALTTSF